MTEDKCVFNIQGKCTHIVWVKRDREGKEVTRSHHQCSRKGPDFSQCEYLELHGNPRTIIGEPLSGNPTR